jgi:hypothetical protein
MKMCYQDKLKKNSSYSLRAFARYLDLAPQVLSEIFRGKRHLPLKNVENVIEKLGISPSEAQGFRLSLKEKNLV